MKDWTITDIRGVRVVSTATGNPLIRLVPASAEGGAAYDEITRLVGAAPALLVALEDLAAIVRAISAEHHAGLAIDDGRWSDLYATEQRSRAAIAGVKGN